MESALNIITSVITPFVPLLFFQTFSRPHCTSFTNDVLIMEKHSVLKMQKKAMIIFSVSGLLSDVFLLRSIGLLQVFVAKHCLIHIMAYYCRWIPSHSL